MSLTIRTIFVALVLGAFVGMGLFTFLYDNSEYYEVQPTLMYQNLSNYTNQSMSEYNDFAKEMQGQISERSDFLGTLGVLTSGAFQIMKLPFSLLTGIISLMTIVSTTFGIPSIVIYTMVILITGIIALIVINVLFSREA